MLCALIGDVLGNISALDPVLDAVGNAGIMTIVQTGNVAVGPDPDACIRRLRAARVRCAQGAQDRLLVRFNRKRGPLEARLRPEEFAALAHASNRISSVGLEWLGALPKFLRAEIDGIAILVCHAAPDGGAETLGPDTPDHKFERYREEALSQLVVTGGPAGAFHRQVADTLFVHPAPVCLDNHAPQYTIVDTDKDPWQVETVRIPHS